MTLCCLCCKSGPISATLYLETIGFVPGEGIPIHVEIENRSGRKISAASVTLLMVNKYVFLTQCLFQESFNTVKCFITNSFALSPFIPKWKVSVTLLCFYHRIFENWHIVYWCIKVYSGITRFGSLSSDSLRVLAPTTGDLHNQSSTSF